MTRRTVVYKHKPSKRHKKNTPEIKFGKTQILTLLQEQYCGSLVSHLNALLALLLKIKNMNKTMTLALILFSFLHILQGQTLEINVPTGAYGIDDDINIIVVHLANIDEYNQTTDYNSIDLHLDNQKFSFQTIPNGLFCHESYQVTKNEGSNFQLFFTEIPLIFIDTPHSIEDEPKKLATFQYYDGEEHFTSHCGIEVRGDYSRKFDKKTYDIELWEDKNGEENRKKKLGHLRKDDDWILDALYNEPLRIRSFVAHQLWIDMHKLYYASQEPEAKSGAEVMYVEMFLNNKYNGVYLLSEGIDKKQLKIKEFDGEIEGELYKGIDWPVTSFKMFPPYNEQSRSWGGFRLKYPKAEEITDWTNIYEFVDFIINERPATFHQEIWSRFDRSSFYDYFIYLNYLSAVDNTGKNIYLARYKKGEPYFYVPWDLDACFGNTWNGYKNYYTEGIHTNGLLNRILTENPDGIVEETIDRWNELQESFLHHEAVQQRLIDAHSYLTNNNVYTRESLVHGNYSFEDQDLDFALNWVKDRTSFLNQYFNNDLEIPTVGAHPTPKTAIYPNPVTSKLYLNLESFETDIDYRIFNSFGTVVLEGTVPNTHSHIPVYSLDDGMYWLYIQEQQYQFVVYRQ